MKKENRLLTIDGETLMSQPLTPLNFVVDTLLSQGLHILAGSPKVGKSWLALWLAVTVAKGEAVWGMEKPSARTLLKSLNAIETSQKAMVRLRDDGVTITARRGENHVDYDQITAAAQTEDLIVLRQGRSVTVVQMSDLVGKDVSSVTEALQNALNCPLMILK